MATADVQDSEVTQRQPHAQHHSTVAEVQGELPSSACVEVACAEPVFLSTCTVSSQLVVTSPPTVVRRRHAPCPRLNNEMLAYYAALVRRRCAACYGLRSSSTPSEVSAVRKPSGTVLSDFLPSAGQSRRLGRLYGPTLAPLASSTDGPRPRPFPHTTSLYSCKACEHYGCSCTPQRGGGGGGGGRC